MVFKESCLENFVYRSIKDLTNSDICIKIPYEFLDSKFLFGVFLNIIVTDCMFFIM
jgi:hypothetical protein